MPHAVSGPASPHEPQGCALIPCGRACEVTSGFLTHMNSQCTACSSSEPLLAGGKVPLAPWSEPGTGLSCGPSCHRHPGPGGLLGIWA